MKRKEMCFLGLLSIFILTSGVNAVSCDIDLKLIDQDPYPAIPGDYVKIVFQADGVGNPDCGRVTFELVEEFPISFDPGVNKTITINSGSSDRDFRSFLVAPFKARIDDSALDGENTIEFRYIRGTGEDKITVTKEFNLTIEDARADFEISIKDYSKETDIITFEVLNIGENDVEALTIEMEKQENVNVKGSKRNIVGSLDSNEDTTFTFEATPKKGGIVLKVLYTDEINVRRTLEKTVEFDPTYFEGRKRDETSGSKTKIIIVLIIVVVAFWWWRRKKKQKEKHHHLKHHAHHTS
jgi:hypothetical protein